MTDTRPTFPPRNTAKESAALSSHDTPIATRDALALLLGPRQADIMQLIWTYGPATVRELHEQLKREYDITYTTVMTVCVRLYEKGLLERRQIRPEDGRTQSEQSYIYTPRISQAAFVRTAVEAQLKELITYFPTLFGAPWSHHHSSARQSQLTAGALNTCLPTSARSRTPTAARLPRLRSIRSQRSWSGPKQLSNKQPHGKRQHGGSSAGGWQPSDGHGRRNDG